MSIYSWIDKQNEDICLRITHQFIAVGNSLPKNAYKKVMLILYRKRLFLILLSMFFLKKSTWNNLIKIFFKPKYSKNYFPGLYKRTTRLKEFWWTLLGFNYFVPESLNPLLSEEQILAADKLHFATSKQPTLSIIIPIFNHLAFTFNCLKSIKNNFLGEIDFEIILMDDQSKDGTQEYFQNRVTGIRYFRNEKNLGFLQSCNKAVSDAKGEFIYLLNNDTQIQPNAIEELLKTIENDQTIGCVGSKLIYPNGLLQEAGGVIFTDGKTLNYGNLDIPNKHRYSKKREVDYCSGASLLFRKNDFLILGMFDEKYIPAYYEDTDLCVSFKNQLHKKVIYVPQSVVIHFESISTGKEAKEGNVKNYLLINRKKFLTKWNNVLFNYSDSSDYHKIQDLTKQI